MCEYCKSCFADPKSDESMPMLLGEDNIITEKGYPLARVSVNLGCVNGPDNLHHHTSRIIVDLHTVQDGETLALVDLPIRYCPFCGAELPQQSNSN